MPPPEDRHARRAAMPIRSFALGQEPSDDLSASTTMDERLAMVWPLTRAAYEAAGLPIDPPPRHLLPGRMIRPDDP
jgi:hypothetical protein